MNSFQKRLKREEWIDIGKQFSIVGLAVFMLWWFTRTLKKTPSKPFLLAFHWKICEIMRMKPIPMHRRERKPDATEKNGYNFDESPEPDERVEVMNRIIQNNPSNMSQAIQSWLKQENSQSN